MRAVVQRVSQARVISEGQESGAIGKGFCVLLGVEAGDTEKDAVYMADKIRKLRVFEDENDKMNLSLSQVNGSVLLVSQFTLFASTKKGNRPSYIRASKPDFAVPMYESFVSELSQQLGKEVKTGVFGANMQVSLVNDGPVTICIDTKNKE